MPASARRVLGAVLAALGVVLAVVGAWIVVKLGPSGEATFSLNSKAPGAIVVQSDVLNSVDHPVRVTATRSDGGAIRLAAAPSSDARAVLASSAISTVSGLHYPAGTVDLRASGVGALSDISTSDVWRLSTKGERSAALVVEQGRGPEAVVITSGDATALRDVTLTLTWADRAWFFEALFAAMIGAVIAAFALNDLWQGRLVETRADASGTTPPEVTE